MLILKRTTGQSIVINNNVKLTVIEMRDHVVRLGFEADKSIPIHRLEVQRLIEEKEGLEPPAA